MLAVGGWPRSVCLARRRVGPKASRRIRLVSLRWLGQERTAESVRARPSKELWRRRSRQVLRIKSCQQGHCVYEAMARLTVEGKISESGANPISWSPPKVPNELRSSEIPRKGTHPHRSAGVRVHYPDADEASEDPGRGLRPSRSSEIPRNVTPASIRVGSRTIETPTRRVKTPEGGL